MTLLLCTVLITLPLWLIIGALNNIFAVDEKYYIFSEGAKWMRDKILNK